MTGLVHATLRFSAMPRLACVPGALLAVLVVSLACQAQPDDKRGGREPWESFADTPEVKAYLEQAKAGTIDAAGRATLTTKVLPLLDNPANVRSMERLRRKIREGLLNERALDAASLDALNGETAKWALARVAAAGVSPVTGVNAMLLVADLRGKDGKPWPGATPVLAAAAADAKLPMAARAAALAGLVRHADAGLSLKAEAARLLSIATAAPAAGSGEGGDWLAARALGLMPAAMPDATPETAAGLLKLLADASRSVDVRVRAAEALGRMAGADSMIDLGTALEGIRIVAIRGLEQDLDAARDEEFGQSISGGGMAMAGGVGGGEFGPGGMRPGFGVPPGGQGLPAKPAPPVEPTILERNAWRLAALASAIQPVGKGRGLVLVAGDAAGTAKDFAARLRENASILHEWVHPKTATGGKKPAAAAAPGGEFAFGAAGGEMGTDAQPTKQDFGQALVDALADLETTPAFRAAGPTDQAPTREPATPANDPFAAP